MSKRKTITMAWLVSNNGRKKSDSFGCKAFSMWHDELVRLEHMFCLPFRLSAKFLCHSSWINPYNRRATLKAKQSTSAQFRAKEIFPRFFFSFLGFVRVRCAPSRISSVKCSRDLKCRSAWFEIRANELNINEKNVGKLIDGAYASFMRLRA